MTRNRVADDTAEENRRDGRLGSYTFFAPLAADVTEGVGFTVAALRLGDHAHLDIASGQVVRRNPTDEHAEVSRGDAGHLTLRWHEWEVLRSILEASPRVHIAEVERPTDAQLAYHVPAERESVAAGSQQTGDENG